MIRIFNQKAVLYLTMKKYDLPKFLNGIVSELNYKKWLQRKATSHRKRDNKRWGSKYTVAEYKKAIHNAAIKSNGFDDYTGETLAWKLINKFDNKQAAKGKAKYKKKFHLLPTVDHDNPWSKKVEFKICSWILNDVKHDLSIKELKKLVGKIK